MAATSAPGANGRGRKVSCTVALAVAGAFAAVAVGMVSVLGFLDGDSGGTDTASGGDQASSPAATPSASEELPGNPGDGSEDGAGEGAVPEKYLGTWEGDAYALSGNLPAGTFRVTLQQAAVGQKLGTFRSTDPIGGVCDDVLVLKKVTKKQITATSIADEDNPGVCTTGEHEVRLAPVGGELQYESDNADAGDPTARMAKVK
ncbi:hypothetical protein FPZ41_45280 [Streptomyces sp. K1PN6]|uniref:Serine/threonine protein kinase n=1 Tax=Streptomyces acidicola TaxID=2596892 RepID=A0A5N8X7I3_9ACTN|nr:hypothetical protein [Streptomyces acidicola]